jgi:DNA-binding transcriptional ArsR family regulator
MALHVIRTLADPSRYRIIQALRRGERAVNQLVAVVDLHQSGVSRHLAILNATGFVQVRADGARRLYSLRPERFRELNAWLAGFRSLWDRRGGRYISPADRRKKPRPTGPASR